MAAATDHERSSEGKISDVERFTTDPCCKKCLVLETQLRRDPGRVKFRSVNYRTA